MLGSVTHLLTMCEMLIIWGIFQVQYRSIPVNIVLGLDAVAASANTGTAANPPSIHCIPHTKLLLTIFLEGMDG